MTGELFDGRKAAELGLVNEAVPKEKLRELSARWPMFFWRRALPS
jgi:enoyl-CoA hydratase/carnithine racemase